MGLNYIALDKSIQAEHSKTKKKSKKNKEKVFENAPGVVFLKHIPYGFFEPQMKKYFEQFGVITRLRLARSKKTGKSKGYAYIEFQHKEVAKLVAETMNNYLMFTRILKCDFVPYEDLHEKAFVGCHRHFQKPKTRKLSIMRYNRRKINKAKVEKAATAKKDKLTAALAKLGVTYNMDHVKGDPTAIPPPRKLAKQDSSEDTVVTGVEKDTNSNSVESDDDGNTSTLSSASDYDDKNVLVVDEEDTEITFKPPPFVKKIISLEEHLKRQQKKSKKKRKENLSKLSQKRDALVTKT